MGGAFERTQPKAKILKVLFLSHTFYGSTYEVGSHKIAREMVDLCAEIWHISTPVKKFRIFKLDQNAKNRLEISGQVRKVDGISTYVPQTLLAPHFYQLVRDQVLIKHSLPKFDLIVVDQPTFLISALSLKRQTGARVIFRPTDIFNRFDLRILGFLLRRIADSIITTHRQIFSESFYRRNRKPIFVRLNGLDRGSILFKQSELTFTPVKEKKMSAVYIGALDERIDWDFIEKIASTGYFETIDLFGPSKVRKFKSKDISLCGPVNYQNIGEVLKSYDCALLPFKTSRVNASRCPMKLGDFLSSGLRIISSTGFMLPEEMKPFEGAFLTFEEHFNKKNIEKFFGQEITCFLDDKFKNSLSFRVTADLILELGSDQT